MYASMTCTLVVCQPGTRSGSQVVRQNDSQMLLIPARHAIRQSGRLKDRQTDRQTDRDRQTGGQSDSQTNRQAKTDRQTVQIE